MGDDSSSLNMQMLADRGITGDMMMTFARAMVARQLVKGGVLAQGQEMNPQSISDAIHEAYSRGPEFVQSILSPGDPKGNPGPEENLIKTFGLPKPNNAADGYTPPPPGSAPREQENLEGPPSLHNSLLGKIVNALGLGSFDGAIAQMRDQIEQGLSHTHEVKSPPSVASAAAATQKTSQLS